jgi:hypothetical protein
MNPKKGIKKHRIVDHEKELMELLSRISDPTQGIIRGRENGMGPANWIVCSSEVANMINSMYEVDEIEIGDLRVEEDSYVQDIRLRPRRSAENLSITFTADTWTEIET